MFPPRAHIGLAAITKLLRRSRGGYSPSCTSVCSWPQKADRIRSSARTDSDEPRAVKAGLSLKGQLTQPGLSGGGCGNRRDWIWQGIHFLHQIGLEYLDRHIINEIQLTGAWTETQGPLIRSKSSVSFTPCHSGEKSVMYLSYCISASDSSSSLMMVMILLGWTDRSSPPDTSAIFLPFFAHGDELRTGCEKHLLKYHLPV